MLMIYISRWGVFKSCLDKINDCEGGLDKFSRSYSEYGMIFNDDNSVTCKEWAPGAKGLYLVGEFSKFC